MANRELPGVSHGTTQCLLCLTGTPGHGHTALAQPAEPPYADPHVRWCGRGGRATVPPIPIIACPAAVQSAGMHFRPSTSPPGAFITYFAEAPGPDALPPSGPVLVMPPVKQPMRPHRWLQRLWLVVFVLFCLEVGIIVTVLPWTKLWTDNNLLGLLPLAPGVPDARLRPRRSQRPRPHRHLDGRSRSRNLPRNLAQLATIRLNSEQTPAPRALPRDRAGQWDSTGRPPAIWRHFVATAHSGESVRRKGCGGARARGGFIVRGSGTN